MDTCVVSPLRWIMLLWTLVLKHLFEPMFAVLVNLCLGVEWPGHMVILNYKVSTELWRLRTHRRKKPQSVDYCQGRSFFCAVTCPLHNLSLALTRKDRVVYLTVATKVIPGFPRRATLQPPLDTHVFLFSSPDSTPAPPRTPQVFPGVGSTLLPTSLGCLEDQRKVWIWPFIFTFDI